MRGPASNIPGEMPPSISTSVLGLPRPSVEPGDALVQRLAEVHARRSSLGTSRVRVLALLGRNADGQPPPLGKLEEVVSAEIASRAAGSFALSLEGMIVAITTGDGDSDLAERILERSEDFCDEVTVGVGRPHSGAEGLLRSFREAIRTAHAAASLGLSSRVVSFRELGIYGMLEPLAGEPLGIHLGDIEELIRHDRGKGSELLPTLEAFFETGSVGEAARALFVHRNTVAYRLRAVERVTGLDIREPDARLVLEVQIRLARLRGLLPPPSAAGKLPAAHLSG